LNKGKDDLSISKIECSAAIGGCDQLIPCLGERGQARQRKAEQWATTVTGAPVPCAPGRDPAFRPIVARTFELDGIVEAHRYLESNTQIGKIVVTVPH